MNFTTPTKGLIVLLLHATLKKETYDNIIHTGLRNWDNDVVDDSYNKLEQQMIIVDLSYYEWSIYKL